MNENEGGKEGRREGRKESGGRPAEDVPNPRNIPSNLTPINVIFSLFHQRFFLSYSFSSLVTFVVPAEPCSIFPSPSSLDIALKVSWRALLAEGGARQVWHRGTEVG